MCEISDTSSANSLVPVLSVSVASEGNSGMSSAREISQESEFSALPVVVMPNARENQ